MPYSQKPLMCVNTCTCTPEPANQSSALPQQVFGKITPATCFSAYYQTPATVNRLPPEGNREQLARFSHVDLDPTRERERQLHH